MCSPLVEIQQTPLCQRRSFAQIGKCMPAEDNQPAEINNQIPPRPIGKGYAVRLWENLYGDKVEGSVKEKRNLLKQDVITLFRLGETLRSTLMFIEFVLGDEKSVTVSVQQEEYDHYEQILNEELLAEEEEFDFEEDDMDLETKQEEEETAGTKQYIHKPQKTQKAISKKFVKFFAQSLHLRKRQKKRRTRKVSSFGLENESQKQKRRTSWTPQAAMITLRNIV
mmetsp:Transcript_5905/g.7441  ORF Transcript_5905/g.7441 Transcript_5905/m.7441 type:complete len:224 (+) Transcript_5905:321-992(+)